MKRALQGARGHRAITFRLASDLHYEMYVPPVAVEIPEIAIPRLDKTDLLVIAGDLHPCWNQNDYMAALRKVFGDGATTILYVPGNHEYYNRVALTDGVRSSIKMADLDGMMARFCREVGGDRFIFLNKNHFDIRGIRFLGTTLWTDPSAGKGHFLNDYTYIPGDTGNAITIPEVAALHKQQKAWLSHAIDNAAQEKVENVVVVTHHVPSEKLANPCWSYRIGDIEKVACDTLHRDTRGDYAPFYYATDMENEINKPIVSTWCFGHDHRSRVDQPFPLGPYFCSNSLGYPVDYCPKYNKNLLIKL